MGKKISIFAGSECAKEKIDYYFPIAYRLGKLLAQNGYTVITGAGPGLMDEVLRGAFEAGGETVGVALNLSNKHQSKYVTNTTYFDRLTNRQDKLIELGDVYIALPGGVGTLYEITNILALKRIKEIPQDRPLLLVDNYFHNLQHIFETMVTQGFISDSIFSFYDVVSTPEDALEIMKQKLHT